MPEARSPSPNAGSRCAPERVRSAWYPSAAAAASRGRIATPPGHVQRGDPLVAEAILPRALPMAGTHSGQPNFSDAGPITSPTAAADAHDGTDDNANAKTPTPEATAAVPLTATTTPPSAKFSHNQATL